MSKIKAYAAHQAHGPLSPYEYEEGPLGADQVDIAVKWCGICHSDLAMINNEWGMTAYPIVPGHEVVGQVVAIGQRVTTLHVGQTVGLGWFSGSCSVCRPCLGGDQNLCVAAEQTIVGRPGGFAQRVRARRCGRFRCPRASTSPRRVRFSAAGSRFSIRWCSSRFALPIASASSASADWGTWP